MRIKVPSFSHGEKSLVEVRLRAEVDSLFRWPLKMR